FSSRRRHTRFSRDWSSDVCSSDLIDAGQYRQCQLGADAVDLDQLAKQAAFALAGEAVQSVRIFPHHQMRVKLHLAASLGQLQKRSEERRVGTAGSTDGLASAGGGS